MKKNLLFVTPYAVVPPRYGGPLRVYNLCYQLAKFYNVSIFAQQSQRKDISFSSWSPVIHNILPNYIEYSSRNPFSIALYTLTSIYWKCPPVWQNTILKWFPPKWLLRQIREADIVHVEHPWQFAWIYKQVGTSKPIILGTQNVEIFLNAAEYIAAPSVIAHRIAREIEHQEFYAMSMATHILAVSDEDCHQLAKRYNRSLDDFTVVPNGVDCTKFNRVTSELKQKRKIELNLKDKVVIAFAGSMHSPNIEAVHQIIKIAEAWSGDEVRFLIIGTVGRYFKHIDHPLLKFTGSVEDTLPFFEAVDIAVNPMSTGSGTNLKQLEFMAMGLPIITTPVGTRGIPCTDGVHGCICELTDFMSKLHWVLDHPEAATKMGENARRLVENLFDWPSIATKMANKYENILARA